MIVLNIANQSNGQVGLVGAPGNESVSNLIRTNSKFNTGMTVGSVQNQAGNFIEPALESTKAAAASAPQIPACDQSCSIQ